MKLNPTETETPQCKFKFVEIVSVQRDTQANACKEELSLY